MNTATLSPIKRLRQAVAESWRARHFPPIPEWAEQHVRLNPDYEASAGRFDLARRPYWRWILKLTLDPEIRTLTIMCSPQLGKTLTVIVMILALAVVAPAPALVVLPDRDAAIEFRDRLYANALESPDLRHLVPKACDWNTRHVELGTMRVYLAWSGSRQRMRGRPCKYVFLSEVDVYRGDKKAGDPVAAADQRVKAFYSHLIVRESSPTGEPSQIAELEGQTDQQRWHVPCPHCGAWQELRFFTFRAGHLAGRGGFAGMQDTDGNWLSAEEARESAHYVCVQGCKITNEHKQAMVLAGRFVAKGQSIDEAGNLVGPPPVSRRHVGVQLWAVHSDTTSFADIAAAYLTARIEGKLADFYQNWLGLAYSPRAKLPTWEQLGKRLAWKHQRGQVWHEVWFLTCGADVQEDRVYWVVRGWGDGCTSWLVDWGIFERVAGDEQDLVKSDLEQLSHVLNRKFPVVGGEANPLGKRELRVKLMGCDSNYRTLDVHRWLEALGRPDRVRAVRGDHKVTPEEKYRLNVVEQNSRTGERYEGGLAQWGIYVNHFKQDLAERMCGKRGAPGSWHVTLDAIVRGRDYLKQVVNEPKKIGTNKQGRKRVTWEPKTGAVGVDFWDCEVYARALAEMAIDDLPQRPGWKASLWPRGTGRGRGSNSQTDFAARDFGPQSL